MSGDEVKDCVVAFYRVHGEGDMELLGRIVADVSATKFESGSRHGMSVSIAARGDNNDLFRAATSDLEMWSRTYLAWGETFHRLDNVSRDKPREVDGYTFHAVATQRVPIPVPPHLFRVARAEGVRVPELFGVEPSPPRPTSEWYEDEKARVYREVLGYVEPEGVAS